MIKEGTLAVIPLGDIDYGDRGRQDYKDIAALATSIREHGLVHPIAIMPHPEANGKYLLLAGGRRLRACEHLNSERIECKIFPGRLSELEIRSIELLENIQREDLEYHEKVRMAKKIRDLMVEIHGRKKSTSPDAPGVSDRDVAKMIGITHGKLSQDIGLAETMEKFPDVPWEQCKNKAEAMKLKENISRVFIRQEAAKQFEEAIREDNGALTLRDAQRQKLASFYLVGDFFEMVKKVPSELFNLVEVDPPYSIDLGKIKKKTGFGNYSYSEKGYNEILKEDYPKFIFETLSECYRVMKKDSWLIFWFSPDPWYPFILEAMRKIGFNVRGLPCVWAKGEAEEGELVETTSGQTNTPIRHLASSVEFFFYAKKGDPKLNKMGRTNHFGFKPVPPSKKIHPTERPLELMDEILTTFVMEGSRVLVPFAGSGNTLISAYRNKMLPIGYDLGEIHREGFLTRIKEVI